MTHNVWIERPLEKELEQWLEAPHFRLYPITGAGGRGKSSLLKRLMLTIENSKPWLMINAPEQSMNQNMLELLMYCQHDGTKEFKKINQDLQKISENILQSYKPSFDNAINLLDKSTDETSYGTIIDTAVGVVKLSRDLINKSAKEKKEFLQNHSEELLWRAFFNDVEKAKGGMLLIDTYEIARSMEVHSKLTTNYKTELTSQPESAATTFHDILLQLLQVIVKEEIPLFVVVVGRGSIRYHFRDLNKDYIEPETELATFQNTEIGAYFLQKLDAETQPNPEHIEAIQELTKGNPLLVKLLADAIMLEGEPLGGWNWKYWQTLEKKYKHADATSEYGLIYYLVEEIMQRVSHAKENLWKLALPLKLYKQLAPYLFPEDSDTTTLSGTALFDAYAAQGIIDKLPIQFIEEAQEQPDIYLDGYKIHAEIKAALRHYAETNNLWRSQEARDTHARLMPFFDDISQWSAEQKEPTSYGNATRIALHRAAYHTLMSLDDSYLSTHYPEIVQKACQGDYERLTQLEVTDLWQVLTSLPTYNAYQLRIIANDFISEKIPHEVLENWLHAYEYYGKHWAKWLRPEHINYIDKMKAEGSFLNDWYNHKEAFDDLLEHFPDNAHIYAIYATFLQQQDSKENAEMIKYYYTKALELDDSNADWYGNYAIFLKDIRKDYNQAEFHYKRALELDNTSANKHGSYAAFLHDIRKDYDQAEFHYKRALELDNTSANKHGNYAIFLSDIRKDYDQAEFHYKRALELDDSNADWHGNYAIFLSDIQQDYYQAEVHYKRALELDDTSALWHGNYANFLSDIRKDYDRAEVHYKRALELDDTSANKHGNYANFLHGIRKDYDQAEVHYKRALELDNINSHQRGNYASFLFCQGKHEQAQENWERSFRLNPEHPSLLSELWFYAYAHMPQTQPNALNELKKLFQQGANSLHWNLSQNIARAEQDEHPNLPLLHAIAKVISEGTDPTTLDAFPEWKNA